MLQLKRKVMMARSRVIFPTDGDDRNGWPGSAPGDNAGNPSSGKYLTFLATTGSTAPFIGLFGTVWGIMDAFHGIGQTGSASLAVVAPGISEALIATAIGLAAAIPAVMGYNHFLNKVNVLIGEMDNFSQEFLNIVERMERGK